jgi:hypothetical protein
MSGESFAVWLTTRSIIGRSPASEISASASAAAPGCRGPPRGEEERVQPPELLRRVEAAGEARVVPRVQVQPVELHRRRAPRVLGPAGGGPHQPLEEVVDQRRHEGPPPRMPRIPGPAPRSTRGGCSARSPARRPPCPARRRRARGGTLRRPRAGSPPRPRPRGSRRGRCRGPRAPRRRPTPPATRVPSPAPPSCSRSATRIA